jgi:hypothetical protein
MFCIGCGWIGDNIFEHGVAPCCPKCFKTKTLMQETELVQDIKVLVLRLMGEDEITFAPETIEVMKRWRDREYILLP